jgi:heat shock protein HslJ
MRMIMVGVVAALSLTACGGQSESGGQGDLIDTPFIIESITVGGTEREVFPPLVISFSPTGVGVATPCNSMNGELTYSGSTLEIGPLASTKMACEPALMEQDQVVAEALESNPTYEVVDGRLTLTGGGTVIFAEAAEL